MFDYIIEKYNTVDGNLEDNLDFDTLYFRAGLGKTSINSIHETLDRLADEVSSS